MSLTTIDPSQIWKYRFTTRSGTNAARNPNPDAAVSSSHLILIRSKYDSCMLDIWTKKKNIKKKTNSNCVNTRTQHRNLRFARYTLQNGQINHRNYSQAGSEDSANKDAKYKCDTAVAFTCALCRREIGRNIYHSSLNSKHDKKY